MGADELIVMDRIEAGVRELNRTLRELVRLFEERTRGDGAARGCAEPRRRNRKGK